MTVFAFDFVGVLLLNAHVKITRLRMETATSLLCFFITKNDFMYPLHLKSTYLLITIFAKSRKYLHIILRGVVTSSRFSLQLSHYFSNSPSSSSGGSSCTEFRQRQLSSPSPRQLANGNKISF